jgi:hypothetical protein
MKYERLFIVRKVRELVELWAKRQPPLLRPSSGFRESRGPADTRWSSAQLSLHPAHLSQILLGHYHVHCVVPGGGLSPDHQRWISTNHPRFLLPIAVLHDLFREKFLAGLRHLYGKNLLDCRGPASAFKDTDVFAATSRDYGY